MAVDFDNLKVGDIVTLSTGEELRVTRPDGPIMEGTLVGAYGFASQLPFAFSRRKAVSSRAPDPAPAKVGDTCEATMEEYEAALAASYKAAATLVPPTTTATAPDILTAAEAHMRQRAGTYDKPEGERSMRRTVDVFNQFHGTALTEAQGWHFMQTLKDVRLFTRNGYHADSGEDGVAYAALKCEALAQGVAR